MNQEQDFIIQISKAGSGKMPRPRESIQTDGLIYKNGELIPWKFKGFRETGGSLCAAGSPFEGVSFLRYFSGLKDPASVLPEIESFFRALLAVQSETGSLSEINFGSVFTDTRGAYLFPPEEVRRLIDSHMTENEKTEGLDRWDNPSLPGESRLIFQTAALLYYGMTGIFPFRGKTGNEIRERIRKKLTVPARLLVPEVKEEISTIIDSILSSSPETTYTKDQWLEKLSDWGRKGYFEKTPLEERKRLLQEGEKILKKNDKAYYRTIFFRKNGTKLLAAAGILILVGSVGSTILRTALAPLPFTGSTPEEVIETFYYSQNTFDHELMKACVKGKAGSDRISEITNLFVIGKVRTAYEGASGLIDVREWKRDGKPELPEGKSVYGILDLIIYPFDDGEAENMYRVVYEKWIPRFFIEADEHDTRPVRLMAEELLTLEEEKERWFITNFELLTQEELPEPNEKQP